MKRLVLPILAILSGLLCLGVIAACVRMEGTDVIRWYGANGVAGLGNDRMWAHWIVRTGKEPSATHSAFRFEGLGFHVSRDVSHSLTENGT